ncbi:ArsR family transcriptional regulator [Nocardia panacis]|uniref:ArsR family transcriptional regulator n=1 Tax=Nocardia panacis TaxID=2340916 RepID=A0A3A4L9X9_9NOCA|nr:ArsR family transcriptional regulator [Nocardia panacis]
MAELERRIATLEERGREQPAMTSEPEELWALTRLQHDFEAAGLAAGGVLFTGALTLPTRERYRWQMTFTTDALLEDDADEAAECLAALGSPVRLRLLRAILAGRRTAAELTELDGVGTSGQIYHHLRQLAAVGWLQTAGRGRFEVPAGRVVPLLVALASARR